MNQLMRVSSLVAKSFHRNVLSTCLITHKVLFFQQPKCALRKSNPHLSQLSLMRSYTNSTFPLPSPQEKSTSPENAANRHLAVGIGVATLVDLIYTHYRNSYNERLLIETVERGTRPETFVPDDELVSRPETMRKLMKILQPNKFQSFYHFVYGENCTGMTTLIRLASNKAGEQQDNEKSEQGGKGIIYVNIPSNFGDATNDFGEAFGKAINFTFEERISFIGFIGRLMQRIFCKMNIVEPIPEWKRALKAFKHASAVYKEKHGKPPVVIYDDISKLNPEVLDILQDDAKDSADKRKYIAVFISNKLSTLNHMENRSAWSRANYPVMEIGYLNEEESINYLVNKFKIKEEEAKKFYELVGGNILNLKDYRFLDGKCFEDIRQEVWIEVEMRLHSAKLLENQLYHKVGKRIIRDLLNSNQGIDYLEFKRLFKYSDEDVAKVLESKIFSYHPSKNTVTFQSRPVENYIQKYAKILF